MLSELKKALYQWRLVHLLALSGLRARFARSKFGQLWITFSLFVLIISEGLIWAFIWKKDINTYLPYVGIGHVFFVYISQSLSESPAIFIADARLYMNEQKSFFLSPFAHLYKCTIVFLFNLPVLFGLIIYYGNFNLEPQVIENILKYVYSIVNVMVCIFFGSYVIAVICTRYRDLIQVVQMGFQIIFFLSPILWYVNDIPAAYQKFIYVNPIASYLVVLRDPFFGFNISVFAYLSIGVWNILILTMAYLVYRIYKRKLIFWI